MAQQRKPFDMITRHLLSLSQEELREIAAMVQGLIEAHEGEEEGKQHPAAEENKVPKRQARGHIEAKMIRGFGPYYYLRYWSGTSLKSRYMGKERGPGGS